MSGTSLDGVDLAYIATDGAEYVQPLAFRTYEYDDGLRARLRFCFGARETTAEISEIEAELTHFHADIVNGFMDDLKTQTPNPALDIIGFHGQTVMHDPAQQFTWQLGDGELLRRLCQWDVVYDFRQADVAAGGQGAPLIPIYHAARVASARRVCLESEQTPDSLSASCPLLNDAVAIVNIGGVSNITWLGASGANMENLTLKPVHDLAAAQGFCGFLRTAPERTYKYLRSGSTEMPQKSNAAVESMNRFLLAFDCGPGNALMDDYMLTRLGKKFDKGGTLAARGCVDEELVTGWMDHEFFALTPPKSLDRNAWNCTDVEELSAEDALATLNEFTARSIAHAAKFLPVPPRIWMVTGGGRLNHHLMGRLSTLLHVPVKSVDDLGWNGDALEAEGFAYMAVRRLLNLPISFPTTTSAPHPLCGGKLAKSQYWRSDRR